MSKRAITNLMQAVVAASLISSMSGCGATSGPIGGARSLVPQATAQKAVRTAGSHFKVPHRYQGETSSCGPSALWSVMTYHLGPGKVNFDNLDRSLRPTGSLNSSVGVMPGALSLAATRYNMTASVTNHATTADLRRSLDNGLPVVVMGLWTDGKDKDMHFVVVNGYEGTDDRSTRWFTTDSYVESGEETVLTTKQLMAFWSEIRLYGCKIPYQTGMVTVAPKRLAKHVPEDNRSVWVRFLDANLKSATDVLRWFDNRNGELPPV